MEIQVFYKDVEIVDFTKGLVDGPYLIKVTDLSGNSSEVESNVVIIEKDENGDLLPPSEEKSENKEIEG